ncbi:MAG: AmmeMemoRadiSam system protein B [Candidatus Neomarinimicrobiota bacterium]
MTTRRPTAAGMFYPGDREGLSSEIQSYLDRAPPPRSENLLGIVVPHAGYIYSGPTAAHAYKYLEGKSFEKVIILAPSHFEAFHGLSIYSGDALETPLGRVNVARTDRDQLAGVKGVMISEMGFRQEHSLEVQLPFLQHVLKPGWEVIPIVMGHQKKEIIDVAAGILAKYFDQNVPMVISSDLSHYHEYHKAKEIDLRFCELVKEGDLDGLWDAYGNGQVEACGFGPVLAFLSMMRGRENTSMKVLDYRNSGDTAGPKDQVVGYCAMGAFSLE